MALGRDRVVGPIPDNQSGDNPNTDGTFSYGTRQGLAVLGGRVFNAWSGNLNGGLDGKSYLDIHAAQALIPAGPRVVDGTMGVVTTTDTSGTPEARGFTVTFDRPIDPSTFSTDDVQIRGRDAGGNPLPPITATSIRQLSPTAFQVEFPAQQTPGTYSYTVGPNIRDWILSVGTATIVPMTTATFDARDRTRPRSTSASRRPGPAAPASRPWTSPGRPWTSPGCPPAR